GRARHRWLRRLALRDPLCVLRDGGTLRAGAHRADRPVPGGFAGRPGDASAAGAEGAAPAGVRVPPLRHGDGVALRGAVHRSWVGAPDPAASGPPARHREDRGHLGRDRLDRRDRRDDLGQRRRAARARGAAARILLIGLLIGGPLCATMALPRGWPMLLVLRLLTGLCLGAAITLTYSLGAAIVPAEHRGAAFGWLGLGLQIGTAGSPLASGALAAVSIPGAFVFDGALAWVAAALLLFGARGLRSRRLHSA